MKETNGLLLVEDLEAQLKEALTYKTQAETLTQELNEIRQRLATQEALNAKRADEVGRLS